MAKKCFLCELDKFVKEWKPLVERVQYGMVSDEQLCEKHLKEILERISK